MVRKTIDAPQIRPADLSIEQARLAVPKLTRRLSEISDLNPKTLANDTGEVELDRLKDKINATLRDVFGTGTVEYEENYIKSLRPDFYVLTEDSDTSLRGNIDQVEYKIRHAIGKLRTLIEIFTENIEELGDSGAEKIIRAYEGLDLHPEIHRAASRLYLDGHYSNAVEAAVKALNGLVRLRSGLEFDGSTLMERAFNPSSPVVMFNKLVDQSDKDEQKGFMMLFSGAVAGLRNPRAHGFIDDSPERALEFIAFVSLLGKLLDDAKT